MKDEIKEILENLSYCKDHDEENNYYPEDIFGKDDPYILLDYITNLQQENKDLKGYLKIMEKSKDNNLNRFLDYKLKIEKTIEYIENEMPYLEEPDDDYENNHKMIEYDKSILLNILLGDDKE